MAEKLVSILIPNFNKEAYIPHTFQSICEQTYSNWECIVVDDHSTDASLDLLRDFAGKEPRIKVVRRPDHLPKGGNSCRNHAYSLASGEFVQWFDSDDLMLPHCLQEKVDFLESHPEFAFVASRAEIRYEEDYAGPQTFHQNIQSDQAVEDYLRLRILFITGGPLFRREVFEKTGLFSLGLKKHQEWELFFRVILNYPTWGIINKPTYVYLIHGNSISGQIANKREKLVNAEIAAVQTALNPATNPFSSKIPPAIYRQTCLRYLRFSLIHKRLKDAGWFFTQYLRQLTR